MGLGMPYTHPDDNVCPECFDDDGLKDFIESNVRANACTFCANESNTPIAASMVDTLDYINECLRLEYDMAEEYLPYETAEGGYMGETWTTHDLLVEECELELPNDASGELLQALCDGLGLLLWCRKDPFSLTDGERVIFSWDAFCRLVKHRLRFFFLREKRRRMNDDLYDSVALLRELERCCERFNLIKRIPAERLFYRARHQKSGKTLTTAKELGPPPQEKATVSNRMSPPGIVLFYTSENPDTALRETVKCPDTFAIGIFKTRREAIILDLADVPAVPSLFEARPDSLEFNPRPPAIFLNHFATELSKPIARDNRLHINYIPTQIITEYFRTRQVEGVTLDGIRYRSARDAGSCSLVLFATQDNLIGIDDNLSSTLNSNRDHWIELIGRCERKVTMNDLKLWNCEGPSKTSN